MTIRDRDFLATPEKKRRYNRALFDAIAGEYDKVTPPLSFWNDKRWKRTLVSGLPPSPAPRVIDFACGTGDLPALASTKYPAGKITGADLSPRMLSLARRRLQHEKNTGFIRADMCAMPFSSGAADIVTGGYALRNAPDLVAFLREVFRILRPGGSAAFLDFSHPAPSAFTTFQYWLLLLWGSFWGLLLHGDAAVYGYIAESLSVFPDRDALERLLRDCGFGQVNTRTFFFGTIAIVTFCKPPASTSTRSAVP